MDHFRKNSPTQKTFPPGAGMPASSTCHRAVNEASAHASHWQTNPLKTTQPRTALKTAPYASTQPSTKPHKRPRSSTPICTHAHAYEYGTLQNKRHAPNGPFHANCMPPRISNFAPEYGLPVSAGAHGETSQTRDLQIWHHITQSFQKLHHLSHPRLP